MVFLSICTALYDYSPQTEGELQLKEGDLVYVLEKSTEDDWWKAKKKAPGEDEDEPIGLVPNNYVENARPSHRAKALYDYSRQTEEELSFSEDAVLAVYDTSDPDWTLVGLSEEYGFAPSNYIEILEEVDKISSPDIASPPLPARPLQDSPEEQPEQPPEQPRRPPSMPTPEHTPAANISAIINRQAGGGAAHPSPPTHLTPEASDEEEAPPPTLPRRPPSEQVAPVLPAREPSPPSPEAQSPEPRGVAASPPVDRVRRTRTDSDAQQSPRGYHLYNVNEMVSVMGKQKKMPTTLGINLATGIILIIPEKERDGPQQEWTAEKLTHYSIEGKHVFMELVKPSKSIDFHAGAKETATEIVSSLGELAGIVRAEGLREVIAAGSAAKSLKKGHMLYDFMAQGDDEVTVADGDEVVILDDTQSEEWWRVRRLKNMKEGVVPSSYVEVTGVTSPRPPTPSSSGTKAGHSTVAQNRLEEERLTREAVKSTQKQEGKQSRGSEVGPGLKLPNRGSSLSARHDSSASSSQRTKRESRSDSKAAPAKSKPDLTKIRTWTDRTGTFKVEAQFVGLKDGKIHLHKLNGVKIAVPVSKMSTGDLEYVERVTGVSLDEDKPLSDIRQKSQGKSNTREPESSGTSGASVQKPPAKPEYDWFDFFLKCGVNPYQCERYSHNFNQDSMDESILPEINASVLRTLGLKEGDILRVMKFLDMKYGRTGAKSKLRNVSFGGEEVIQKGENDEDTPSSSGGLFAGPGGALKNNTRKGRPAPAVQTNDVVDSKVFQQNQDKTKTPEADSPGSPKAPPPPQKDGKPGFDDNAWDVRPAKQQAQASQPPAEPPAATPKPATPVPAQPALTGALADLSLLSEPLKPVVTHSGGMPQASSQQQAAAPQSAQAQPQNSLPQPQPPQGANPTLSSQIPNQQTGAIPQLTGQPSQQFIPQQTGQFQPSTGPRQRPSAPPVQPQGTILPPPPVRPLSAPQNISNPNFSVPALQPQLTGMPNSMGHLSHMSPPPQNTGLQQQMGQQPISNQFTGAPSMHFSNGLNGTQGQQQPTFFQQSPMPAQATGAPMSQFSLGNQVGSPFADPRSQPLLPQITGFQPNPTGYSTNFSNPLLPQQTGPSFPALGPQSTGINGAHGVSFGQPPPVPQIPQQFGQAPPPIPPIPQQPTIAPLQPQKTGPPPPVRFGMQPEAKKLVSQATGRRANLSHATPDNPFGFDR